MFMLSRTMTRMSSRDLIGTVFINQYVPNSKDHWVNRAAIPMSEVIVASDPYWDLEHRDRDIQFPFSSKDEEGFLTLQKEKAPITVIREGQEEDWAIWVHTRNQPSCVAGGAGQDSQVAGAEPQQLQHVTTHLGRAQKINRGRSDCVTVELLEWQIHRDGYNQRWKAAVRSTGRAYLC